MSLKPFIEYFLEEALKKKSRAQLLDADLNKACFEICEHPVDITPRALSQTETIQNQQIFTYQNPKTLYVYPSKEDAENYLPKAEQLIEAMHGIRKQAVFEIRGNKRKIVCLFYGEKEDIAIIDSAIRNFYPKTITDIAETAPIKGNFFTYDFLPDAPFYKSLTSYRDFTISPLNIIPQLLLNIDKDNIGAYQVLFTPLSGECHDLTKEAIDSEWQALQGPDNRTPPSLLPGSANKRLEYKSPDFKSYYAVCFRLILPNNSLETSVKAFISNYTYGSNSFKILDNQYYSQNQTEKMLNDRISCHKGFLVNSHELTGIQQIPYQIIGDKAFTEIFATAPVGDKPVKTTEYKDIAIGKWACGNSSKGSSPEGGGHHHI